MESEMDIYLYFFTAVVKTVWYYDIIVRGPFEFFVVNPLFWRPSPVHDRLIGP